MNPTSPPIPGESISPSTLITATCGTNQKRKRRQITEIESTGEVLTVLFVTDSSGTGRGFTIGYTVLSTGTSQAVIIACAVVIPLVILLLLLLLLCFYCRYWRKRKDIYTPHQVPFKCRTRPPGTLFQGWAGLGHWD